MLRVLAPLCLCLLVLTPVARTEASKPVWNLPLTEVDTAIERGVDYVLKDQRGNGSWGNDPGKTALAVFALLHGGLRETTAGDRGKRMRRAWTWLERFGPGAPKNRKPRTYGTALTLLALEVRGREEDRAWMQRVVDALVGGQAANGQWTYELKSDAEVGDNSNTQFAVLALGMAWGRGLRIPRDVVEKARAWWQDSPQAGGGFGYASGGSMASAPKHSMTAAGIGSLAILDSALSRAAEPPTAVSLLRDNAVLRGAYDWLANDFSLTPRRIKTRRAARGAAGQSWPHYYLWTLERALVLLGVREIARVDWFAKGTRRLLDQQKKDGSWRGEAPLYATCFALLFLTRAADPARVFTHSAPVTGQPKPAAPAHPVVKGTVEEWLRSTATGIQLTQWSKVRGASTLLPLVRALDDPDRRVRARAFETLRNILPKERLPGIARHPLPRARLAFWLRRNAGSLTLVDGRFRLPSGT